MKLFANNLNSNIATFEELSTMFDLNFNARLSVLELEKGMTAEKIIRPNFKSLFIKRIA